MKKIKFTIDNNTLIISYKVENNTFKNLNNTNIITKDDLVFDMKYFKNNLSLVAGFLNVMVKNESIVNAIIESEDLIILGLEFLSYMPNITELVIAPDINIDYDMHLAILKNDTLKKINCYQIPTYLLERIDTTKSVKIETRVEVFFVSNFLRVNKLTSYSDVFYKRKIIIDYEFTEIDFKDFEQFLSINTYLKVIYFEYINMDLIKNIIKYLREYKKKNIIINIRGSENNLRYFNTLEDFARKSKYIRKNGIKFKIDYTKEYKIENFLNLLSFTTLRYILIVVIISCVFGYGINEYNFYKSSEEIDSITGNISDLLEEFENLDNANNNPNEGDYVEPEPDINDIPPTDAPAPNPTTPNRPAYISPYYKNYAKVISVLKETNPETVGWLTVNNTNINYPITQATNNSYYLNHDFNRNSNSLGWVFMDFRNNPNGLDQNTILYGHNSSKTRLMFGTLSKTLNSSWYTNVNNQYITFNTSDGDKEWRIFSIYTVASTNDYLYTNFSNQDEFLAFANMIQSRSIYNFHVEIKPNDKILTLSTCQSGGKDRLVVHAVLI